MRGDVLAVELHPVAPLHAQLRLEELLAFAVGHLGAQDRPLAAVTHQRGVGDAAERLPREAHATASSSVVLPCAFAPEITVTPGENVSSASW